MSTQYAEEYLTLKEYCRVQRISERTARRMVRDRKIPGLERVGGQWRIKNMPKPAKHETAPCSPA